LQAVSLVLGLDTQLSDSILLRFQAQPGFYGTDNFESQDVNIPFVVVGTYIYSPNLRWSWASESIIERKYPVYPEGVSAGDRAQWVLDAVLPTPRLEFQLNKDLTLYAGGTIKETNFRVDESTSECARNSTINQAVLTMAR